MGVVKPYGEGVRLIYPFSRASVDHRHTRRRIEREMFLGVLSRRAGSNRYPNSDDGYESDTFNDQKLTPQICYAELFD